MYFYVCHGSCKTYFYCLNFLLVVSSQSVFNVSMPERCFACLKFERQWNFLVSWVSESLIFVTRCSESIGIPGIQFVIILVSSLLMNFSFVFIFKMIYAYFWVCFGFVFAKINCTFMFAMAHAKHIFTVSVSCLWSCLSLFFTSQCLKYVLRVSYLKGNKIS